MVWHFISILYGKFVSSQTASFSRADINWNWAIKVLRLLMGSRKILKLIFQHEGIKWWPSLFSLPNERAQWKTYFTNRVNHVWSFDYCTSTYDNESYYGLVIVIPDFQLVIVAVKDCNDINAFIVIVTLNDNLWSSDDSFNTHTSLKKCYKAFCFFLMIFQL